MNDSRLKLVHILKESFFTLVSLLKVLRRSHWPHLLKGDTPSDIYLLGNGPSLISSLNTYIWRLQVNHVLAVNSFAETPFFELIKPRYYLLLDPLYWRSDSSNRIKLIADRICQKIGELTKWPMIVFLPFDAKFAKDWQSLFDNKFVKVVFFNSVPLQGFKSIVYLLYRLNLGMPYAQNVLVAAIFLAINLGYRNVFLFGTDHSWHEDIALNESNVVCLRNRHFYDSSVPSLVPWEKGDETGSVWKMHEVLRALSKMFEGYWELEEYSKHRRVSVYNCSSTSFIDAFSRRHLRSEK